MSDPIYTDYIFLPFLASSHWPNTRFYVQGTKKAFGLLKQLPENGLAVVGTRFPTAHSLKFVTEQILALSQSSLIIISGLAVGIDAAAHQAALKAQLPTIAFIATCLEKHYPSQTYSLRQQILAQHGLIITEYHSGSICKKFHFLQRNRLIAASALATWVVEAPARSGALNTAFWSQELQRTCFATPCYPDQKAFAGNQKLLDDHHATSFWGLHSLGSVWLSLATHQKAQNQT